LPTPKAEAALSTPYFICVGRQQKRSDCKQRAIRVEVAERAVEDYYSTVQLPAAEVARLREYLGEELAKLRRHDERERTSQTLRLRQLKAERKKLLDAHYADAVPLDLLKSEQARLGAEIANAEERLEAAASEFAQAEVNLEQALVRAGDCHAAYLEASDKLRRQFNMAFFRRICISDEGEVMVELAEPFDTLLGDDLRRAAVAQADRELRDAVEEALNRRAAARAAFCNAKRPPSQMAPVGAGASAGGAPTSTPKRRGGFSPTNLVRSSGLEPPRAVKPTRPSTSFAPEICVRSRP
jgi:hypothetical protein